jgi:hypothetical protein
MITFMYIKYYLINVSDQLYLRNLTTTIKS